MFGLLKNKLSSFIGGLVKKEEKKEPERKHDEGHVGKEAPIKAEEPSKIEAPVEKEAPAPSEVEVMAPAEIEKPMPAEKKKPAEEEKPEIDTPMPAEEEKPIAAEKPRPIELPKTEKPAHKGFQLPFFSKPQEKKPQASKQKPPEPAPKPVPAPTAKPAEEAKPEEKAKPALKPAAVEKAKPIPAPKAPAKKPEAAPKTAEKPKEALVPEAADLSRLGKRAMSEKKEIAPKIGIGTTIKSFFSNEITIGESEVADLLEELELSLLEADVAYDASLEVTSQLRSRLVGMKVPKKEVEQRTKEAVQQVLESVMDSDRKFDFLSRVKSTEKPVKILFVGPNGAGKTTTMAKVAHMLKQANITTVFAAADTFRAAAIEQTEVHAERLGLKVIKSKYGADPASVAFDAISYAKAHNIEVVLIDSAGRQDTNANLLDELRKINRVAKPDIKIYVGESIGGNALIEQIKAFHDVVGMDGAILTKIDCDAKGGTAISVAKATGIPVLFLGTGQGYSDLEPFDAHKIAQEIMG
ncbi:Signal recognition particle receptor FtsY [uncultured archaeon]|nr:Signal recognition particle receptor FtsY [uncultured archaeon]